MESRRIYGLSGVVMALAAAPATADTTLQMDIRSAHPMQQTIQVSQGRVRVDTGVQGRGTVILYREGSDQYQILDGREKTVMTITRQQAQQTMQQAAGMMQQMQAMMAERMKNMPPEQQAQMAQMMAQAPGAGGARPKPEIRTTGRSDKVGSWSCKIVEVVEAGQGTSELCIAQPKALGIPERDHQTLQGFFKLMASLADSARRGMGGGGQAPFFGPDALPGVPVRAVHTYGGKQSRMQLTQVATGQLSGSLFEVPKDYRPMQMPMVPGAPVMR